MANKDNTVKEQEVESKLYRLIEMNDAIYGSIDNAEKVKKEQLFLIEVLKNNNKDSIFDELIKTEEEQVKTLDEQINTLSERGILLTSVIGTCSIDKDVDKVVTSLMLALGLQ